MATATRPDGRVEPGPYAIVEALPRSEEAEEAVLGSILMDPGAVGRVAPLLTVGDFYHERPAIIYGAALAVHTRGVPVDFVTVTDELRRQGRYDEAGGLVYLSHLVGVVPTAVHVVHYAELVRECAERRRLMQVGCRLVQQAHSREFHPAAVAENARRALEVPELKPYTEPVSGSLSEVSAAELKARGATKIDYLPLLGARGYIARGWSNLVASYPKMGKTELLVRCCLNWTNERILYITEEPESIWGTRLSGLPGQCDHVQLLFGLGVKRSDLLARIEAGDESVVVIDTIRNVLGLLDERDNSEVARVLTPFVAAARQGGKTLILSHHLNKAGGEDGRGITGGHAFLGIVDVALEIGHDSNLGAKRRRIRGWGRLSPIEEAVYELREGGSMAMLGPPRLVELGAVRARALEVLDGEWARTRDVLETVGEPAPSLPQVREALDLLVADGQAERDPAVEKRGATYRYRRAGSPGPDLQRPLYMVSTQVAATEDQESGLELYPGDVPEGQ